MENSVISIEDYFKTAPDDAKTSYMKRIWNLDKDGVFHELMRVHAESSKLLMQAQAEIERLNRILNPEDGDARH